MTTNDPWTVPLEPGSLACRHCGRALPRDDAARIDLLEVSGYWPRKEALARYLARERERLGLPDLRAGDERLPVWPKYEFATCATCAATLEQAAAIVAAHPRVEAAVGTILSSRVEVALFRLDVMGKPMSADDIDALTDAGVRLFADHMGLGGVPRWADRFSPERTPDADPETSAVGPWAHVGAAVRPSILRGYAEWLAARADRPEPVECPSGGCRWCGVDSVTVMRSRAGLAWTPFEAGHLCLACTAVRDRGLGNDNTAIDALWEHIDPDRSLRKRWPETPDLVGARPWAQTGRPPSARPWAWLDVETFRRKSEPSPRATAPARIALQHEPEDGEW